MDLQGIPFSIKLINTNDDPKIRSFILQIMLSSENAFPDTFDENILMNELNILTLVQNVL